MYIKREKFMEYMRLVLYASRMTAPQPQKFEHEASIAEVRNSFADAVGRARYSDEPTVLTSRSKRVAVIVSMEFYERALAALGETRMLKPKG